MWSFSNARLFDKCQRAWFYKTHVANANATKNPLQREAYILSKLQTIWGWRGKIVDRVISERIVPELRNPWALNPDRVLEYALLIHRKQSEFALLNRIREAGMSETKGGEAFAAFYAVEYGNGVSPEELAHAWEEVQQAVRNLLNMTELLDDLRRAEKVFKQRSLTFSVFQSKARAVPDLIAFFPNEPPLIIDWKVHSFGDRDYRLQLATYAVALARCKPHQDFPVTQSLYAPENIRLIEVQLLTNVVRPYRLTGQDVDSVESRIVESSVEMSLAAGENEVKALDPFDYPVAEYPEACEKCLFRKLCWKD